jgi:hypothetical protein
MARIFCGHSPGWPAAAAGEAEIGASGRRDHPWQSREKERHGTALDAEQRGR